MAMASRGEHKQLLVVDEYQGKSLQLEVCEEVLAAVTTENRIRLWKLEQREVKPSGLPSGRKVDTVKKILSVRCNCDGTKLSFLAENDGIEPKNFVYDDYLDKFLCHDFGNNKPVSLCWDDGTVGSLRVKTCSEMETSDEFDGKETFASHVFTFFVTSDYRQSIFDYGESMCNLL